MPSRKPPGKGKGGRAGGRIENGKKPFGDKRFAKPDRGDKPAPKARFGSDKPFESRKSTPSAFKPADDVKPARAPRASKPAAAKPESKRFGKRPPKAVREGGSFDGERTPYVKKDKPFGSPKPRGNGRPQTRAYPKKDSPDAVYNKRPGDTGEKPKARDSYQKLDRPTSRPAKSDKGDSVFREVKPGTEGRYQGNTPASDGSDSFVPTPIKPRVPGAFGQKPGAEKLKREDKRKLPETKRFGYGKGKPVDFNKPKKNTTNKSRSEKNRPKGPSAGPTAPTEDGATRLNKYMAHAGIAARRAADEIIASGEVTVNGEVVKEMGYRVQPTDVVKYQGKTVKPVRNMVYILLNKPKDYITTTSDDLDRHTVMELVASATDERVYPVGRLDRNTTGLLLMTNDGDLAQKLSHPSRKMKKIYHAVLDKPISEDELEQIAKGLVLEDGVAQIDAVAYADRKDRAQVGIELHIGKNRIVRRIFEHLGYDVVKLDRVFYGGLTKKDLPRGRWRHLEDKEVIMLKHFI